MGGYEKKLHLLQVEFVYIIFYDILSEKLVLWYEGGRNDVATACDQGNISRVATMPTHST